MTGESSHNVHIVSLGCPKNFVDTEVMAASLLTRQFGITPDPAEADVFLINTCAFLPSAREEAEEFISEAVQWKKESPGRRIIVTGCLNQWDSERTYAAKYPEVDLWVGINQTPELGPLLERLFRDQDAASTYEPCRYLYDDATPRLQLTPPHYAYLKITEGCDNCCAYCSIPRIRGPLRSRSIASVVREARNLLDAGVRELILIGQDITAFGHDGNGGSLAELLRQLDRLDGDFMLRLLYAHPAHVTDELIATIAAAKHVLPYLDLPLQHISDRILASMGRYVTRRDTETLLDKLTATIPDLALRTTFITGYPGETEAEFQELRDFVAARQFRRLGVFAYCAEPQTRAAMLPAPVPAAIAAARRDEIMALQAKMSLKFNQTLVGKNLRVIIDEKTGKTTATGRTYMDAPEIDNLVDIRNLHRIRPGATIEVKITACSNYDLEGKPAIKKQL
ncbi:MAG: 30S ribosomal protein S12 methylthiotransferase RimO [Victivallales bacterium]|nr:30S ribosomal protein S12 methylthiotransferase RimO [Victivallales bacterium]